MYVCCCFVMSMDVFCFGKLQEAVRHNVINCLFILVTHPAHEVSMVSLIILEWYDLVEKALVLGYNYQPVCFWLSVHCSLATGWSCGDQHQYSFILFGYLPWSALSSHCISRKPWARCHAHFGLLFLQIWLLAHVLFYPGLAGSAHV